MDLSYSSYQNGSSKETDRTKLSQTIGTSIQKISVNVTSIQKMVSQLGTPQETSQLKTQLHEIQHYTQQLAKDTSSLLKELSKIQVPPSEQKQWKMSKERLMDEFTETLNRFQQVQRNAHQREKDILQRDRASSGLGMGLLPDPSSGNRKYTDHLIELQDQSAVSQQQQQQMIEDEANLQALERQEQDIRQLESDIMDVNTIFKDLGQMVHEQGEKVDNIEAHVEQASTQISMGAQQLHHALESQTKLRKKKLCLLISFLVALVILILIIVWSTR